MGRIGQTSNLAELSLCRGRLESLGKRHRRGNIVLKRQALKGTQVNK